jgi:anthranilate 1,2-dioxygenase small subunit
VICSEKRAAIEDTLNDYAFAVDDDDLERWPEFFTEDGFYQIIPRETHEANLPMGIMFCDGRGMMHDRVEALRTANIFEPHTYSHLLGRPQLRQGENGTIEARTNFQLARTMQGGTSELFAAGKYLDVFDVSDERPRIRKRLVVLESRRIDILLVFPI